VLSNSRNIINIMLLVMKHNCMSMKCLRVHYVQSRTRNVNILVQGDFKEEISFIIIRI